MLKSKIKPILDEMQEIINEKYKNEGLSDEILVTQVQINSIRKVLDIPDENEKTYEEFVQ